MRQFTLREWEKLRLGDEKGCIPAHLAERISEVARASAFAGSGGGGVLEQHRHYLRARGVVGVLTADNCTLEILPKIDVPEDGTQEKQNASIRKRLVHMLAVALDLQVEMGRITELDWQRETLLEILIRAFCDKLTDAVRRGMPRRYIRTDDDLTVLRGSLDLPRQLTRHVANFGRLACRFDELSEDITLNQILKAAVTHLHRSSRSAANQNRLRDLGFVYADVSDVPVRALKWGDVVIDRTNRAWRELFEMAKLFLRNQNQTTSAGAGRGTALLFEMNTLFEEYIGRLLIQALIGTDFQVSLQGGRLYCLTSMTDGRSVFQTKPDILIRLAGEVVHVIDTKWKRLSQRIDDPKQGVSQSDIYQMMAYAHLYAVPRVTLLYPHHVGLQSLRGTQGQFHISNGSTILELASIDVCEGIAGVVKQLRRTIEGEGDLGSGPIDLLQAALPA